MSDLRDQLDAAICDADFDDMITVARNAITEVDRLTAAVTELEHALANAVNQRNNLRSTVQQISEANAQLRNQLAGITVPGMTAQHAQGLPEQRQQAEDTGQQAHHGYKK